MKKLNRKCESYRGINKNIRRNLREHNKKISNARQGLTEADYMVVFSLLYGLA